jgi:Holliday junction resolvase RusA-like endonuclease
MPCIDFMVDVPPSANSIWRSYKGRVIKSKAYTVWQQMAQISLGRMGQVQSPVCIEIDVYMGRGWRANRDLDNIAKPIIDLIKSLGFIEEDNTKVVQEIRLRALPPDHKDNNAIVCVKVSSISKEKSNDSEATKANLNSIKKKSPQD